jgi:hypothetical protein
MQALLAAAEFIPGREIPLSSGLTVIEAMAS